MLLLVALAGAVGSLARYGLLIVFPDLPATLVTNVVGSFLLGVLVARRPAEHWSRPVLGAGVLGGFTTYSAFAVQTVDASLVTGIAYVAGTLVIGVGAAAVALRVAAP